MDATLLEADTCRDADLLALVSEMREEISQLRREVAELRCEAGYRKSRHADAVKRNEKLQEELDQANAEIRNLKADLFGRKSEKQSSADRSNHLDDPQDQGSANKKRRGQQPDRLGPTRRDYSHLPVREKFIDVPSEDCVCGRCGKPLADLGETEDSEQVEIELSVYRRRIRRRRYRKTCNGPGRQTLTAPKPPKLIPKGRYGVSLWVHLLLEKFHSGRPIQRTIEQLRLYGLPLAAGTITDGLKRIEPLLQPIYTALRERNVQSTFHHADETRWLVFVEKQGKNSYRWWLWVFAGEDSVVTVLDPTRAHEVPEGHFPADAQRDAELADPKLREPCRKVLTSLMEHWSGLTVFLNDPRIPLDNNFAERLMRNPAVGRKNYYGSGAEWAGRLATMMFSILATLKLWKINPRLWLLWCFESCAAAGGKAPCDIKPFLPWNLSDERRAALSSHNQNPELADSS